MPAPGLNSIICLRIGDNRQATAQMMNHATLSQQVGLAPSEGPRDQQKVTSKEAKFL